MTLYSAIPLSEPLYCRLPGARAQRVEWCVVQGSRLYGAYPSESTARATASRLNAWLKENTKA